MPVKGFWALVILLCCEAAGDCNGSWGACLASARPEATHASEVSAQGLAKWAAVAFDDQHYKGQAQTTATPQPEHSGECDCTPGRCNNGSCSGKWMVVLRVQEASSSESELLPDVWGELASSKQKPPKGNGKGKGKPQDGTETAPKVKPGVPDMEQLPKPPTRTPIAGPSAPSAPSGKGANNPEKAALDKLMATLKANEAELTQPLRDLLEQHQQEATKDDARAMHRVVASQANAKKVSQTLQDQVAEHGAMLQDFAAKEEQWEGALTDATTALAKMTREPTTEISSEEDMMDSEERVDAALQAEQRQQALEARSQQQGAQLLEALAQVQQAANEEVQREENRERTPRRSRNTTDTSAKDAKDAKDAKHVAESSEWDFMPPFEARWSAIQLEAELDFDGIDCQFTPGTPDRLIESARQADVLGCQWHGEAGPLQQVCSGSQGLEHTGLGDHAFHATADCIPSTTVLAYEVYSEAVRGLIFRDITGGDRCTGPGSGELRSAFQQRPHSVPLSVVFSKGANAWGNALARAFNRIAGLAGECFKWSAAVGYRCKAGSMSNLGGDPSVCLPALPCTVRGGSLSIPGGGLHDFDFPCTERRPPSATLLPASSRVPSVASTVCASHFAIPCTVWGGSMSIPNGRDLAIPCPSGDLAAPGRPHFLQCVPSWTCTAGQPGQLSLQPVQPAAHTAPGPSHHRWPNSGHGYTTKRCKDGSMSNLGASLCPRQVPTTPPAGPTTMCATPGQPSVTDLHMILASHVNVGPDWLGGPFLHSRAYDLTRLGIGSSAHDPDSRYTILEFRMDTLVRRSLPEWTPMEYVAHAIRQVPYRVHSAFFLEVPLPGYPCPQILLTPVGLPVGHRTVPIDLRDVQGMLHVVKAVRGNDVSAIWPSLHEKGVKDAHRAEEATRSGSLLFLDQSGQEQQQINSLPDLQWFEARPADHAAEPFVVEYVGGGPLALRVPRPLPAFEPPRGSTAADIEAMRAAECGCVAASSTTTTTLMQVGGLGPTPDPIDVPPAAVFPEAEPPSLLIRHVGAEAKPSRPSPYDDAPQVVPGFLETDRFQQANVDAYSWGTDGGPRQSFTIFDVVRHVTTAPRPREGTLAEIIRSAVISAPFQVGAVQVLMHGLRNLPQPQLVLYQRHLPIGHVPIPWDLRPVGGEILTVNHKPQESRFDAIARLRAVMTDVEGRRACDPLEAGHFTALDATGIIGDAIPLVLTEVQHFVVEPTFTGFAVPALVDPWGTHPAPFFWPVDGPSSTSSTTSTTSTGPNPEVDSFRFTMLYGPHTHSAIVQTPCLQADAILERLIREVLAQGYPYHGPFFLMMAAGQPALGDNQQEVIFLLCNSVHDRTAAVVVDERPGGHPLCSHHVAPQTMCDRLITGAAAQRGVSVVVNGAPARLAPKWAMQGDYIQFDEGRGPPPFTPTSWHSEAASASPGYLPPS
ncbi:Calmodulin [Symbiodinium sp. CCMP2592]|nr:Calmodulin [Symbiodinium sp. CCMP2592]